MNLMKRFDEAFDRGMIYLLTYVHLDGYYQTHTMLQRFMKYGSWIMLEYWFIKGPLTALFTEGFGLWYVISAFFSGLICTVFGFFLNDSWVWGER